MKKIILSAFLAGAVIAPAALAAPISDMGATGISTKSPDQGKACQAVFDKNKSTIESMAGARNSAGIQGLFSANGCQGALVNLGNSPLPLAKQQQAKVKCTFKLIPPTITCTFGIVALPIGPRSY